MKNLPEKLYIAIHVMVGLHCCGTPTTHWYPHQYLVPLPNFWPNVVYNVRPHVVSHIKTFRLPP